jgi:hypothetical protein
MLTGIFDQLKNDIIGWNQAVELPIYQGDQRWTKFTVSLRSYRVMAAYEPPFSDEDPQFVGASIVNNQSEAFAAPTGASDVELGDTYDIGLEVMNIDYLNLRPHSAELAVRAYDTSDPLARVLLQEFAGAARATLNGVTATIPLGDRATRVGSEVIDKIISLDGGARQIGSHYIMFLVPRRFWNRPANLDSWTKYKFVVFAEEDPEDKETPYKEIYMTPLGTAAPVRRRDRGHGHLRTRTRESSSATRGQRTSATKWTNRTRTTKRMNPVDRSANVRRKSECFERKGHRRRPGKASRQRP